MVKEKSGKLILKIVFTIILVIISFFYIVLALFFTSTLNIVTSICVAVLAPLLIVPIWYKNRKRFFILYFIFVILTIASIFVENKIKEYDESLRIKTNVNINVEEYMPFDDNSKIVKLEKEASLKLDEDLPIVDGAAAVFPVYSAFVNAVYPQNTDFGKYYFRYNNTVLGYKFLAEKQTDIFFGSYPSQEQIDYAKENNTEFEYTQIGKEGFVFFVNKDNPVENLTSDQIRKIYSGEITNWKEVGGKNEKIIAFQRNEGSGSQSRLIRFMNGTKLMEPQKEQVNEFMVGIIEQVADYKNYSNSIGFSFRYYLEELIANPDIKMISVDSVAPTKENISNETYPLTGSLYAVTYKGNQNKNVKLLLDWILSDEGQEIVEKTGYARVK